MSLPPIPDTRRTPLDIFSLRTAGIVYAHELTQALLDTQALVAAAEQVIQDPDSQPARRALADALKPFRSQP